jgi:tetratricopeptide (TPR) repeat protein
MTEDVDAYALFLQARTLYQARRALDDVDALLARAIELDPGFAAAWAYRAGTQFLMQSYRYSDLPIDELLRRGLEYAQRALELDPESATATAVIANMYVSQRTRNVVAHDWVDIIDLYDRAIELDPRDGSALNWRGLAYAWVGYLDLALADFRQCVRYEPLYSPCVENLHWFLADMGRDDEALEVLRKSLDAGDSKILYSHLGLLARRNNELAFKAATNDVEALRDWRHHDELYRAFHDLDADHAALAASIAEFAATHPDRSPDFMYPLLMALGHYTDATNAIGIWSDTGKKYRQSGHFRDFMRRIGAVDYWNEVGPPPGCRLLGDNDFECD